MILERVRPTLRRTAVVGVATAMLAVSAGAVLADGALVTRGDVHAFAAGAGSGVTGRAQMVRTADGKTIVSIHVEGLAPNTAYGAHVHKQACAVGDADGHYRFDPAGAATPPNEIWPAFTTNAAGIGNGDATADAVAGPTAVSVVVHAPGGAKIACADLE
jgi:Cu-Zn family superoxide dismutase